MTRILGRATDRLLAKLVPQGTAGAAFTICGQTQFCYCSRGLAYRRIYVCRNNRVYMTPCTASGTC